MIWILSSFVCDAKTDCPASKKEGQNWEISEYCHVRNQNTLGSVREMKTSKHRTARDRFEHRQIKGEKNMMQKTAKGIAAALTLTLAAGAMTVTAFAADHKIGYNYFGTGGYSLAAHANQTQVVLDACGDESVAADDQFSVETLVTDIENMVAAGCDGVVIWLPAEPLYETVANICAEKGVYFVLNDKVPSDPAIKEAIMNNEYFAGACAPANAEYGKLLGQYALDQGWKTCITTSSAEGDATDQPRLDAFKEVFEAGGGEVLDELHADTTADSLVQIQDSLVANDEPDFIYGVGSDYAINACTALESYPDYATKVISSGLDKEALGLVLDEYSPLVMLNGDDWISGFFSAVMLQNAVEGNKLTDADGNTIWVEDVMPFEVTSETYDLFEKYFMNESVYTEDEIKSMVGISYDEMMQIIDDFSLENRLNAKYEAGIISEEEMKSAGLM